MIIRDAYRPKVIRFRDKVTLLYSEIIYLAKRVFMRIIMGKLNRDRWFKKHKYSWLSPVKRKIILCKDEHGLEFWATAAYSSVLSSSNERNVLDVFKPRDGDVVIDVGAHIGKYAVYAGSLVGKKGKVIALEPNEERFHFLCRNIKQNSLEGSVIAIRTAVADKNGKSRMFCFDGALHSLVYGASDDYFDVNTVTIDSLVANMKINKVDWMKIDVDGAEYKVLMGAKETLRKNNLSLVIEVLRVNEEKVFDLLRSLGLSVLILESYDYESLTGKGCYNVLASKYLDDNQYINRIREILGSLHAEIAA